MSRAVLLLSALGAVMALAGTPGLAEPRLLAQADTPPPPGTSRGENFSAKPAPQLFASDCTGAGCHKGPQGLAKGQSQVGLANFLREHYTNSRQSAAALAAYLTSVPGTAPSAPRIPTAATAPNPRAPRAAARSEDDTPKPPAPIGRQPPRRGSEPAEATPTAREASPTAIIREPPAHTPPAREAKHTPPAREATHTPPAEPSPPPKLPAANARAAAQQRGARQTTATPAATEPVRPPTPAPKHFDIFD
jgi:hypothetical protein